MFSNLSGRCFHSENGSRGGLWIICVGGILLSQTHRAGRSSVRLRGATEKSDTTSCREAEIAGVNLTRGKKWGDLGEVTLKRKHKYLKVWHHNQAPTSLHFLFRMLQHHEDTFTITAERRPICSCPCSAWHQTTHGGHTLASLYSSLSWHHLCGVAAHGRHKFWADCRKFSPSSQHKAFLTKIGTEFNYSESKCLNVRIAGLCTASQKNQACDDEIAFNLSRHELKTNKLSLNGFICCSCAGLNCRHCSTDVGE